MSAGNETGGAATPPENTRNDTAGAIGRYHGPGCASKAFHFLVDGERRTFRGNRGAFVCALIDAGDSGVAHIEALPWLLDASAAAVALNRAGVQIATRRGKPSRWVLQSQVREVRT